jgi:hypothetical protein
MYYSYLYYLKERRSLECLEEKAKAIIKDNTLLKYIFIQVYNREIQNKDAVLQELLSGVPMNGAASFSPLFHVPIISQKGLQQ